MKFYIEVYGCQMNVYDSQRLIDYLSICGFHRSDSPEKAEILIFYTCNIRAKAAARLFSNIERYRHNNTKIIAVGGCVAQVEKENLFRINKYVNLIFGSQVYHKLPTYLDLILNNKKQKIIDIAMVQNEKFNSTPYKNIANISEYVTIQEGCNNFCTYCVVPYARGIEYSRPAKEILQEIKNLLANGTKEIVLLGQNVNSYRNESSYNSLASNNKPWDFARLLREVATLDGLKRLRYTTSHPKDFNMDLMLVHKETPVLAPLVHIPVQSGSDRILKLMNREHTASEYLAKLELFREIVSHIQFSSDFIVGFPSETEDDFAQTLDLAEKAKYTLSYSFKFSPRKNTPAEKMSEQISDTIKTERLKSLQNLLMQDQKYFNTKLIDTIQEILFEKKGKKANQYIGKNNYLQSVVVQSENNLIGTFQNILIKTASDNCVNGEIV